MHCKFIVPLSLCIGYGHVVPLTPAGKSFCILYAALGIPFTLVFLSACVQRLLEPTFRILAWLMSAKLGRLSPLGVRLIHLSILAFCFGLLFVVVPTFIFTTVEPSWEWLDGIYFVFISLTTIGLGDYIPGDSDGQQLRDLYKSSVAGKVKLKK